MHSDWFWLIAPELVVLNTHPHWELKPKSDINCHYDQTGLYMDLFNQFQHKSFHLCVITATKPFWWQSEDRCLHPLHTYCLSDQVTTGELQADVETDTNDESSSTPMQKLLGLRMLCELSGHKLCCWITVSILQSLSFQIYPTPGATEPCFPKPKNNKICRCTLFCTVTPFLNWEHGTSIMIVQRTQQACNLQIKNRPLTPVARRDTVQFTRRHCPSVGWAAADRLFSWV